MKGKHFVLIGIGLFVVFFLTGIGLPWLVSSDQLPLFVILAVLVIALGSLGYMLWEAYQRFNREEDYMRDIHRIRPFLEEICDIWETMPDLRFGQLFYNVTGGGDPFNIEDDKMLKMFKEFVERTKQCTKPQMSGL